MISDVRVEMAIRLVFPMSRSGATVSCERQGQALARQEKK